MTSFASALCAASEGLEVIVIESMAPDGQAGTSSRIENYLGFPIGISGQALAGRARIQALKFGAWLAVSRQAVYLSRIARHVHILVRGPGLAATMSDHLIRRIDASARITLHKGCEITGLEGDRMLRDVEWTCRDDGAITKLKCGNLFVMIGAVPNTDWLGGCLERDPQGFILTGARAGQPAALFETSRPGIYAAGDVRSGSVKRVASAVGEGSVVVQAIHGYLESLRAT
jgi:thioredoxin reductase (NADPH)